MVEDKNLQKHLVKGEKEGWSITPSRWSPHNIWN